MSLAFYFFCFVSKVLIGKEEQEEREEEKGGRREREREKVLGGGVSVQCWVQCGSTKMGAIRVSVQQTNAPFLLFWYVINCTLSSDLTTCLALANEM
jgi:hypothetical protein